MNLLVTGIGVALVAGFFWANKGKKSKGTPVEDSDAIRVALESSNVSGKDKPQPQGLARRDPLTSETGTGSDHDTGIS
ncbi:hypothetical protein [Vibrio coralliilyticus]|uniref:hypothetical protein n=1 Tax=Vibrio coralliilyticus TaxID=190893 RepID=UPI000BAC1DD2|nr:hypothetical protein [Vibrio coralliilyticus]PAW00433.1 hypothetical protein CKJ79_26875 [Vibrio coralliilyticus]